MKNHISPTKVSGKKKNFKIKIKQKQDTSRNGDISDDFYHKNAILHAVFVTMLIETLSRLN